MHPYPFTHTYHVRHNITGGTPVVLIGYNMFITYATEICLKSRRPSQCRAIQRKDIVEHRAGKVARLASWRKMTQPGEFCWW
jgi:hypothetical protein